MSKGLKDMMAEAVRLTREGNLSEATAEIQRALGGAERFGAGDDPEEHTGAARRSFEGVHDLRRITEAARAHRGAPAWPGGTSAGVGEDATDDTARAPGRFVERTHAGPAGTRSYKLYVPSSIEGRTAPLVVMLHGCTQSPDDIAAGTRMNVLAEAHGFLVAYPAQSTGANNQRCWNWFEARDQRRGAGGHTSHVDPVPGAGEPSIIAGITREVADEHAVAGNRVYVAGMSAGGAMAAILASEYPDLYAAVGVHSGLAPGAARDMPSAFGAMRGGPAASRGPAEVRAARPVPAIIFHGDRDKTVHPANADHVARHMTGGSDKPPTVRRGRATGGRPFTLATHTDARGRAVCEQWTIHGLGHAWSGGSRRGSFTDPEGPDASAEMVRFFLQQRGARQGR